MSNPAAFLSRAREVLAWATDRDAHGFPSPLPWYVSGERPMIWADDGDALVSIGPSDQSPYIEPPVAALIVLAVNSLAALCDVVEAAGRLADKLEAMNTDPRFVSVFALAAVHGCNYREPTWEAELEAARSALARLEVPE